MSITPDNVNRPAAVRRTLGALVALALVLVAGCSNGSEGGSPAGGDGGSNGSDGSSTTQVEDGGSGGDVFGRIPAIVREVEPAVVAVLGESGEGSGVIWDANGTIVTNHHVIAGGGEFQVAFADGTRSPATVVASDPLTDLAVLGVDREDLPAAKFAEELPAVGELAIALGNPLGFENTVTAGIVSGLHRSIPGSAPRSQSLIDLIQTDAAISPGNSGGALVDAEGRVIGINVAYIPPEARAVSIGFAIPAATVVDVVEQLLEDGQVSHPFFGVQPGALTEQIRQRLGLDVDAGVVVLAVVGGGPAADAGIRSGDVITELDGEPIESVEEFLAVLRQSEPGDDVNVQLVRAGRSMEVTVTLTDRPNT